MTTQLTTQHSNRSDGTAWRPNEPKNAVGRGRERSAPKRVRRSVGGGALALMLVLTACGSSGSDEAKDPVDADKAAPTSGAKGTTGSPKASEGGGTGLGTVEIGDVRYELTITRCTSLAGAISGGGVSVSEPDNVDVTFEFPPADWATRPKSEGWTDNPTIRLDSEEPYMQWSAGPTQVEGYNLPDGLKATDMAITNVDIADDLQSVTGEAQFIDVNAIFAGKEAKPTAGTFSFSCPPKN